MANNLTVTGNLAIGGSSVFTGTADLAGGALNTDLVTNFNADLLDGAELSTDGTLADNSDTAVPTEKAVKTYADTNKVALTGDQTVAGVKTFSSPIVGDLTGNVTGNVTGDVTGKADEADGIVETEASLTIKTKLIIIGDWDMDATVSINVAHGFADVSKIRFVDASIRDDDGPFVHQLSAGGSISVTSATYLTLIRTQGGHFDSTDFNRTGYNRGWIKIEYEA